jgi:hypothetical protein
MPDAQVANAGVANGKVFERSFLGGPRAAWGSQNPEGEWPCRARGAAPLHVFSSVSSAAISALRFCLNQAAVVFVLRFLSGREPGGVQRQSLKLPYAGWLPHERLSSQARLGLSAGVGEELLPKGLSRITMTGRPVPHPIRWDSSTQVVI